MQIFVDEIALKIIIGNSTVIFVNWALRWFSGSEELESSKHIPIKIYIVTPIALGYSITVTS